MTKPKPPTLGQKLLEGLKEAAKPYGSIEASTTMLVPKNLYDQLKSDLDKTKKALEDTNNGRPSSWAYSILRKERDELMVDAAKLVDALEHYCDIKCYCAACIGDPRAKACNDLGRSEMRNAVKLWHSRNVGKVADKAVCPTNTIVCKDPYHWDTSISTQVYDICPSCKGK